MPKPDYLADSYSNIRGSEYEVHGMPAALGDKGGATGPVGNVADGGKLGRRRVHAEAVGPNDADVISGSYLPDDLFHLDTLGRGGLGEAGGEDMDIERPDGGAVFQYVGQEPGRLLRQ